jgi:hypothetical protein
MARRLQKGKEQSLNILDSMLVFETLAESSKYVTNSEGTEIRFPRIDI